MGKYKVFSRIVDDETKLLECIVCGDVPPDGFSEREIEQGFDGNWYLKGYAPEEPIEHKNEQIRQQRQSRFAMESDPLYLDYVEAQARGDETVDEKKQLWLDKKDEIRKELPYIESEL